MGSSRARRATKSNSPRRTKTKAKARAKAKAKAKKQASSAAKRGKGKAKVDAKSKATPPRAPKALTGKQRSHLRALGHHLNPVIQLGHLGLTEGVVSETTRALETHELIKLKLGRECPEDIEALPTRLEAATGASVVQLMGHTLLVYRARTENPTIVLPVSIKKRARKQPRPEPSGQDDVSEEF